MDLILLIAFFTAAVLLFIRRMNFFSKIRVFFAILALGVAGSLIFVNPPKLQDYELHRANLISGKYDWAMFTFIPYSPKDHNYDRQKAGETTTLVAPNSDHPLGTNENGSDVLVRIIYASRVSLGIGFVATSIALLIGVLIGGVMGYFSGILDILGMRIVEIFEAIPTLFLLLMFVAFFRGDESVQLYLLMVIIGLTSWTGYARYIRAEFLRLRQQDFVQSAIATGLPLRSILFRHMLPNGVAPVLVGASFGVASAILAEATLSYLGLGLTEDPSWGQMLQKAVNSGVFNWWLAFFPGLAIFLTVFSYNLIGEALRDAIDPHLKKVAL